MAVGALQAAGAQGQHPDPLQIHTLRPEEVSSPPLVWARGSSVYYGCFSAPYVQAVTHLAVLHAHDVLQSAVICSDPARARAAAADQVAVSWPCTGAAIVSMHQ